MVKGIFEHDEFSYTGAGAHPQAGGGGAHPQAGGGGGGGGGAPHPQPPPPPRLRHPKAGAARANRTTRVR